MDIATIAGVLCGLLIMFGAILAGGAPLSIFFDVSSILCVLGGTACAVIICFPLKAMRSIPWTILKTVCRQETDSQQLIDRIVSLAELARRDGMLSLDGKGREIEHDLLRLGVQLAVDGTRPEVLAEVLRTKIEATARQQALAKGVLDQLGRSAPAFGMIGTLLGLVMMLNNLTDPSAIGGGMAVALLTTLYGAVLANLFCLPLAEKLAYRQRQELRSLELIVKGVLALQAGEHPRLIAQRLSATQESATVLRVRRAA